MLCSVLSLLMAASAPVQAVDPRPAEPAAPKAPTVLKPGNAAPDFTLTDSDGAKHKLSDYTAAGNVVVLEWFNPQCPAVAKFRADSRFMAETASGFADAKVVWLAIDSNAPLTDGGNETAAIRQFVKDNAMTAPVLLDRDGAIGHAYGVSLTPTVFVVSPGNSIAYSGAPDTSSALERRPAGDNLVKAAVSATLDGAQPKVRQTTPYGCAVSYAPPVKFVPLPLPTELPPARPMPQAGRGHAR
jgi:peroxiredoxin